MVESDESKGNDMMKELLAQVFGHMVNSEGKLDIIKPDVTMKVTFSIHPQFAGIKKLEEEMSWLMKDFSERFNASRPKMEAPMTQSNTDLVARLAAELPKKGEDRNWSDELRVAVWKRRQRDEVRANVAQTRRIEELQQQVLDLMDQLEAARFDAATADTDVNGDTEVLAQEDPAARAEALTGVAQALANIAEVRAADDGVSTVLPEAPAPDDTAAVIELVAASTDAAPPEAPAQEVAPIAELPVAEELPVDQSAAAPEEPATAVEAAAASEVVEPAPAEQTAAAA